MNTADNTHTCAVCAKPIKPGFLMCFAHWKLVPDDTARQVLSTYGYISRGAGRRDLVARSKYMAARQAAIDAVNQRIAASAAAEGQAS